MSTFLGAERTKLIAAYNLLIWDLKADGYLTVSEAHYLREKYARLQVSEARSEHQRVLDMRRNYRAEMIL